MKKLIILIVLVAVMFLVGCLEARYVHDKISIIDGKPIITEHKEIIYRTCNSNIEGKKICISSPNDVNVTMDLRDYKSDPNSFKEESKGVNRVLTGGTSDVLDGLTNAGAAGAVEEITK